MGAVFGPFVYTITDNQIVIFQQILYENIISISRSHLKKQVLRILSNQRSIFKTKQKFRYHIFECLGIQVHVYKDGVVNLHHIFLYV